MRLEIVIVYTLLVVTMTVYCMRCLSRKVAMVENDVRHTAYVHVGVQTVRDVESIMDHTVESIKREVRLRGLKGTGSKEQLALRLHEHLVHEASDDFRGALGRF